MNKQLMQVFSVVIFSVGLIALMMIAFVIFKSRFFEGGYYVFKKSEIKDFTEPLPDDCVIYIWIGRNTYEEFRNRNYPRRNLRNNISE